MDFFVHESSFIDDGARVGPGTKIWHFSHVMCGAEIGAGCTLGQNVFVATGVKIGDRCRIQNNVSLYQGVVLDDEVFCGPGAVFTNVRTPRACVPRRDQFQKTSVARGATIGANATIVCGVSIGRWAFVAAGAVVTREVPAYALVAGTPARRIGWACRCGAILVETEGQAKCAECGSEYEIIPTGLRPRSEG